MYIPKRLKKNRYIYIFSITKKNFHQCQFMTVSKIKDNIRVCWTCCLCEIFMIFLVHYNFTSVLNVFSSNYESDFKIHFQPVLFFVLFLEVSQIISCIMNFMCTAWMADSITEKALRKLLLISDIICSFSL